MKTLTNIAISLILAIGIFLIARIITDHTTLTGNTHTVNGVEYKCARSDDTLWLCFEEFETFMGFDDYRVAFEYNPQTNTVGKIAHYGDGRQL